MTVSKKYSLMVLLQLGENIKWHATGLCLGPGLFQHFINNCNEKIEMFFRFADNSKLGNEKRYLSRLEKLLTTINHLWARWVAHKLNRQTDK